MKIKVQVPIRGSRKDIWKIISDIENAASNVSGIEKIEILENPDEGLVGLKWMETRTLFGKTATETMWVTEAQENQYYKTRAESHGSVYTTNVVISEDAGKTYLGIEFSAKAQGLATKLLSGIFGLIFKHSTKKALYKDLNDIKRIVEKKH